MSYYIGNVYVTWLSFQYIRKHYLAFVSLHCYLRALQNGELTMVFPSFLCALRYVPYPYHPVRLNATLYLPESPVTPPPPPSPSSGSGPAPLATSVFPSLLPPHSGSNTTTSYPRPSPPVSPFVPSSSSSPSKSLTVGIPSIGGVTTSSERDVMVRVVVLGMTHCLMLGTLVVRLELSNLRIGSLMRECWVE